MAGEGSTANILTVIITLYIRGFPGVVYEISIIMTIHQQRTVTKLSQQKTLATEVQIPWQSFKVFRWQTSALLSKNVSGFISRYFIRLSYL